MFFPLFPFLCIIKGTSTHYFQFQYSLCAFSYSHENGDSHSLLKIKSTSGTINLGAWKSADLRVPVTAPEGYTPIGLMSFDTAGAIPICINAMMVSTVEVTVGLTNPSADTANNTGFTLSALYIKSTFVC